MLGQQNLPQLQYIHVHVHRLHTYKCITIYVLQYIIFKRKVCKYVNFKDVSFSFEDHQPIKILTNFVNILSHTRLYILHGWEHHALLKCLIIKCMFGVSKVPLIISLSTIVTIQNEFKSIFSPQWGSGNFQSHIRTSVAVHVAVKVDTCHQYLIVTNVCSHWHESCSPIYKSQIFANEISQQW